MLCYRRNYFRFFLLQLAQSLFSEILFSVFVDNTLFDEFFWSIYHALPGSFEIKMSRSCMEPEERISSSTPNNVLDRFSFLKTIYYIECATFYVLNYRVW
jgi:hypothetical protein